MNDLFLMLGIESWKPVLSGLLLPPVPLLLLALVGARMMLWRRAWGWLIVLMAVAGLWLGASSAVGEWLQRTLLPEVKALSSDQIAQLRRNAVSHPTVAIVVLGGGREALAPEYGVASLGPTSLERLRYAVWLSRQTGASLLFSGGLGHAAEPGAPEAEVAAEIASREFGRPLRWTEARSRDTRENAQYTVALLRNQNVSQIVLVTHGWHVARAMRAFAQASAHVGANWVIVAAPMGLAPLIERPTLRWVPTWEGFFLVRTAIREKVAWWFGA